MVHFSAAVELKAPVSAIQHWHLPGTSGGLSIVMVANSFLLQLFSPYQYLWLPISVLGHFSWNSLAGIRPYDEDLCFHLFVLVFSRRPSWHTVPEASVRDALAGGRAISCHDR